MNKSSIPLNLSLMFCYITNYQINMKSKKVSKKVTLKGGGPDKKIRNKKVTCILFSGLGVVLGKKSEIKK